MNLIKSNLKLLGVTLDKAEAFQKRRLKTIFPHIDGSDKQIEDGNLARLTTYISDICERYAQKVINEPNYNQNTLIRTQRIEFMRNSLFHKHGV